MKNLKMFLITKMYILHQWDLLRYYRESVKNKLNYIPTVYLNVKI